MTTYAVDFESHYSDTCSIGLSGTWNYLRHPDCDIYMVAIVGDDGTEWVGRPEEFNWSSIARHDATWVAHNYSFDAAVYTRLIELGKVPDVWPGHWFCSADAAAYHGLPRNLKGAIEAKFKGILEVSKDTRNAMKGQHWDSMTPEFQKEVSDYALHDSRCCLALWKALEATFPWHERMISQHTAWMGWEGLPVNRDKIEDGIQTLKDQMWEAEQNIPWAGTEKLLSPKALADECRKVGINPPRSLAQDSEECEAWLEEHGGTYPWIAAMRTWRRCNALLKKLEAMLSRVRPDGVMGFGMKFFGAHTGRDSGDAGLNVQNFSRGELFGVNMREMIEAPEGKTFVIVDLAQVEPRCARPGTLVKTDNGYKHIESVTKDDKLYDGNTWVRHDGLVERPNKSGVRINGEYFTHDHKLLTSEGWVEAQSVDPKESWRERGATWNDIRLLANFVARHTIEVGRLAVLRMLRGMPGVWDNAHGQSRGHSNGEVDPLREVREAPHD